MDNKKPKEVEEYKIHDGRMGLLKEKFAELAKKAAKCGCEPPTFRRNRWPD